MTNGVSLDFADKQDPVAGQHYAFLAGEAEFDEIMAPIGNNGLTYWADPARQNAGEINTHDGGRGVYFEAPDGHLLEAITRPYGNESRS
jgi:catechol 2,3-dioxygenase-like lactoylglutathione lyase family enzyme